MKIATRDQWLTKRKALLARERELTHLRDQIAAERRKLPWVRVEKDYLFDTDEGPRTLRELFGGRSQLLAYHFMFGPDYRAGCPSCSSLADGFNGFAIHLANHDVMLTAVSRAPLASFDTGRALRFYEDEALIAPERRGTQRLYTDRDRARVAWILRGKRVG